MANEINNALKSTAEKIARYVDNVSKMTVETRFVNLEEKNLVFDKAQPAARTEIQLDGDCYAVVPTRTNEAGVLIVDNDMFEMHQRNVQTAIEYRARMMDALLQTFNKLTGS